MAINTKHVQNILCVLIFAETQHLMFKYASTLTGKSDSFVYFCRHFKLLPEVAKEKRKKILISFCKMMKRKSTLMVVHGQYVIK